MLLAFENCCTIIDYFEAKDSVFVSSKSFCKNVRELFTKTALSIVLGDILPGFGQHEFPRISCYSVTYELTYHHFPNPIESVGKSVLSSTFTLYL